MFTYAHVKWFYGQSERAYYLNYFIMIFVNSLTCSNIISVFVVLVFPGLVMELVPSADLVTH